jgi:hypothetical protein
MINFPGESIAGSPLCCQQRPVPRTRRWQGVPFCVLAPQIETVSSGSVGRSVAVPSGPYVGSLLGALAASLSAPAPFDRPSLFVGGMDTAASSPRSTIKGGGAGRATRPATSPMIKSPAPAIVGKRNCALRWRGAQSEQNRLLVQRRQRERSIRDPHSEQKLGLYMVRISFVRTDARRTLRGF